MLLEFILGSLGLIVVILTILFIYVWLKRKPLNKHPFIRFIPGYPIIGNLLDFVEESQITTCLNYRKQYGPFVEFYLFTMKALMVSDSDICKEILRKRPKGFRRTSLLEYPNEKLKISSGLFSAEGKVWSHIRKATAPSFSNLNITLKFPVILEEILLWLQRLQQLSLVSPTIPIDMKKEASYLTIRIITIVAFGLDPNDALLSYFFQDFSADVNHIFTFLEKSVNYPLPMEYWKYSSDYYSEGAAIEADKRFTIACQRVINYKRELAKEGKLPMNCMMDSMIAHATTGEGMISSDKLLTDEEIIANVKIFYIAGSDTTSLTITWMMYYFALYPTILSQLREEVITQLFSIPSNSYFPTSIHSVLKALQHQEVSFTVEQFKALPYTQATIKEALRMNAPAIIIFLESNDEPVALSNGMVIEPHQFILINTDGLHFDPDVFPSPQTFSPQRWLHTGDNENTLQVMESSFFPFGYGPRMCPGMNLALVEVAIAISMIALFIEKVDLLCPPEEIKRIPNFIVGVNQMPVALHFYDDK